MSNNYSQFYEAGGFSDWNALRSLGMQRCRRCGETKLFEEYYRSTSGKVSPRCKSCVLEGAKEKRPERVIQKSCVVCGASFVVSGNKQRYCSACAAEKQREHVRSYRVKRTAAKTPTTRKCERCGNSKLLRAWPRGSGGHLLRYCGDCKPISLSDDDKRKRRKLYKETKRRLMGVMTRDEIAKRSKQRKDQIEAIKQEKRAAKIGPQLPRLSSAERLRRKATNDPCYVLNVRMRVQIRKALKGLKGGRRWESIVGYTVNDLYEHLRRQLPKGYEMNDFFGGRLHIDHICPKSMFDVRDEAQMKACWALSNLRPLPAKHNLRKGSKRTHLV